MGSNHQLAYEYILSNTNVCLIELMGYNCYNPKTLEDKVKTSSRPFFAKLPLAQFVGLKENLFEL